MDEATRAAQVEKGKSLLRANRTLKRKKKDNPSKEKAQEAEGSPTKLPAADTFSLGSSEAAGEEDVKLGVSRLQAQVGEDGQQGEGEVSGGEQKLEELERLNQEKGKEEKEKEKEKEKEDEKKEKEKESSEMKEIKAEIEKEGEREKEKEAPKEDLLNKSFRAIGVSSGEKEKTRQMYSQFYRRYALLNEFKNLALPGQCPSGLYVIPNEKNFYLWHGVLFLSQFGSVKYRTNPAIIKFVVEIPENYPEAGPQIRIFSPVFHPLIAQSSGIFELKQRFSPWRPQKDLISHVFFYMKETFTEKGLAEIKENQCLNQKALQLLRQEPKRFGEISSHLAEETKAELDNSYDGMGISFQTLSREQEIQAYREIFKDHKCSFDPEADSPDLISKFVSVTSKLLGR